MKVCIDSASNIKARKKSTEPSFSQILKIDPILFFKNPDRNFRLGRKWL